MAALRQHIVIARHADRHVFQVRKAWLQRENVRDFGVVEITQDLANVDRSGERAGAADDGMVMLSSF